MATLSLIALLAVGCAPFPEDQDLAERIHSANEELLNRGNVAMAPESFAPASVVSTSPARIFAAVRTHAGLRNRLEGKSKAQSRGGVFP